MTGQVIEEMLGKHWWLYESDFNAVKAVIDRVMDTLGVEQEEAIKAMERVTLDLAYTTWPEWECKEWSVNCGHQFCDELYYIKDGVV